MSRITAKGPYLYFAEALVETTTESLMVPASSFLQANPTGAGTTTFSFKDAVGSQTTNIVTLTHTSGKNKEVIEAMATIINSNPQTAHAGMLVVADIEDTTGTEETTATGGGGTSQSPAVFGTKVPLFHKAFNGLVTSVAIA
tara:strand:+ start:111 stop:536 length:426 start_codon:yes stop_codon:yes gene_type:complete